MIIEYGFANIQCSEEDDMSEHPTVINTQVYLIDQMERQKKMENRKIVDNELEMVSGGTTEELNELKAWAVQHNPDWADRDPASISNFMLNIWMYRNIPEYDGFSQLEDGTGPVTYYVKGMSDRVMTHEEMMAFLTDKYGV